jgi:2-polyprenyl-3-methyl-5-hydroxy-6-metoxy-1,4-benzoquinol methylase
MVKFDSDEYWKATIWDRHKESNRVPLVIKEEFIHQETLLISAISKIVTENNNTVINLLDLGCGPGRLAQSMINKFRDNIYLSLLDLNPITLDEAKTNLSTFNNVDFIQGSFYDLNDLVKREIDIIVCMDIFHHVCHLEKIIELISNKLKNNGVLIGNVFCKEKYKEWDLKKYGFLKSMQRQVFFWFTTRVYCFFPEKIRLFIRKAGLARIEPIRTVEMLKLLNRHFSIIDTDYGYYLWFCVRKSPRPSDDL